MLSNFSNNLQCGYLQSCESMLVFRLGLSNSCFGIALLKLRSKLVSMGTKCDVNYLSIIHSLHLMNHYNKLDYYVALRVQISMKFPCVYFQAHSFVLQNS